MRQASVLNVAKGHLTYKWPMHKTPHDKNRVSAFRLLVCCSCSRAQRAQLTVQTSEEKESRLASQQLGFIKTHPPRYSWYIDNGTTQLHASKVSDSSLNIGGDVMMRNVRYNVQPPARDRKTTHRGCWDAHFLLLQINKAGWIKRISLKSLDKYFFWMSCAK